MITSTETFEDNTEMSANKTTGYVITAIEDLDNIVNNPHNLRDLADVRIVEKIDERGEIEGFQLANDVICSDEYRNDVNSFLDSFVYWDESLELWVIENKTELVLTPRCSVPSLNIDNKYIALEGNARLSVTRQIIELVGTEKVTIRLKYSLIKPFDAKAEEDIVKLLWTASISGFNERIPVLQSLESHLDKLFDANIGMGLSVEDAITAVKDTVDSKTLPVKINRNMLSQWVRVKSATDLLILVDGLFNLQFRAMFLSLVKEISEVTGKTEKEIVSESNVAEFLQGLGKEAVKTIGVWNTLKAELKERFMPTVPNVVILNEAQGTVTESEASNGVLTGVPAATVPDSTELQPNEVKVKPEKPAKLSTIAEAKEVIGKVTDTVATVAAMIERDGDTPTAASINVNIDMTANSILTLASRLLSPSQKATLIEKMAEMLNIDELDELDETSPVHTYVSHIAGYNKSLTKLATKPVE